MRQESCYDFLHTDDFSPYTCFFNRGMLFRSLMYKVVLFCFGRAGYKCMLSFGCRHLAIRANAMVCAGGKRIENFSLCPIPTFFSS